MAPILGIAVPALVEATTLLSIDTPGIAGCRSNTQLCLETAEGETFQLLIEAQDRRDPVRSTHWARHVSYLWAERQLPTALLIMCRNQDTARWAEQPVSSGPVQPPALTLHPFVAGPHNLPLVTDPDEIHAQPALAALSAIMHPADRGIGGTLKALSTALRDLPNVDVYPIAALTDHGLDPHPAQRVWRELMKPAIREREQTKARAESLREGLLRVLGTRGLLLSPDMRARVMRCNDPEIILDWLARVATASCAEEIFEDE
ncbi:hypothetical protein [Streptomyces sp. NPDC002671]